MKRLCVLVIFAMATPVAAQDTPPDLSDMVGARAGQGESELQRRGYRNVGGEKSDDRSYTYWWNGDRRQCVTIATMNGRYNSIVTSPAPDCRQPASTRPRDRDRSRQNSGVAAPYELSQLCRGQAATRWDRRPSEITVNAPIRQRGGSITQGWFQDGSRSKFFTCRFDDDGRFLGVD